MADVLGKDEKWKEEQLKAFDQLSEQYVLK